MYISDKVHCTKRAKFFAQKGQTLYKKYFKEYVIQFMGQSSPDWPSAFLFPEGNTVADLSKK
ncbi:hypothetical protein BWD10_03235 [Neisseria zoodegmatis]|uniref:Uncharacterized protein n=1 Tax=Neisseria zoodegmatis TaxID=326523 RepID=A0ABX3WFT0_9NEIS|nr:hypothetical protein BWD10_03235 [Neisseria zoodegmatis]